MVAIVRDLMNSIGAEVNHLKKVTGCGFAVLAAFVVVFALSKPFEFGSELPLPIVAVTGFMVLAAIAAYLGLANALKIAESQHKHLMLAIVGLAVSVRMVALFTCPILEIDYYRYLWDGKVVAQGISPYRFTPQEVRDGSPGKVLNENETKDGEPNEALTRNANLQTLALLSIRSESNHTILNRIHYEEYTTLYPPVSQLVFGLAMNWFPETASVEAHVLAIKLVMVLFDIATMAVVFWILWLMKFHPGWLVLYAWNPLVIKEVANGGHLDSIAAFFLTLSVLAIVKFRLSTSAKFSHVIWGGVALGLGVGAKLSPAVLLPALAVMIARRSPTKAILFSLSCLAVVVAALWPMIGATDQSSRVDSDIAAANPVEEGNSRTGLANKEGLVGFFSKWRMNDPIFSTLYLNLKSQNRRGRNDPWFVVTTEDWRERFCGALKTRTLGSRDPAFIATRGLTLGLFAVFYLWQMLLMFRGDGVKGSGESADQRSRKVIARSLSRLAWIMACFLVLQPTVNPWYFVWIAPLACFTKNRGWVLVSGALLIYYLRFWFKSLSETWHFFGSDYTGVGLFDHLVVFVEFGLIVFLLVCLRKPTHQNRRDGSSLGRDRNRADSNSIIA